MPELAPAPLEGSVAFAPAGAPAGASPTARSHVGRMLPAPAAAADIAVDAPASVMLALSGAPSVAAELTWDERHFFNAEGVYCYCGESRTYGEVALRCSACDQWFHGRCIRAPAVKEMMPLQRNYLFTCRMCVGPVAEAEERLELIENSWSGMAETAILNLALNADGRSFRTEDAGGRTTRFSLKDEITPWIREHFASVGYGRELVKLDEKQSALEKRIFTQAVAQVFDCVGRSHVGLRNPANLDLTPLRTKAMRAAETRAAHVRERVAGAIAIDGAPAIADAAAAGAKRAAPASGAAGGGAGKKARRGSGAGASDARLPKGDKGRPKPSSRALDAPVQPQIVPENSRMVPVVRCSEMVGIFQEPAVVQLSVTHKASQLRVSKGSGEHAGEHYRVATGHKGYRTVCATHAVGHGTWYYEVRVIDAQTHDGLAPAACRLGWATELATPDAPAGYDEHSYSYRSKAGTAFHQSIGRRFGGSGYGQGDVIGCLLHLPQRSHLPRQAAALRAAPRRVASRHAARARRHT